jgi:uncharacterized membrane protein YadS
MLYELKFFSGIQDIKIMTGLGALIVFKIDILILVSLILIVGLTFKFGVKFKNKKQKEFPFIPVFLIVYLIFIIIKYFI